MIAEDRIVQNNLLQKLDELVGEIGRHESLHGDGDVFGILGFWQGCLYYLQNKRKMLSILGQVLVMISTCAVMYAHDYLFHAS